MSPITKPDLCNALAIRKAARHVTGLYDRHLAGCGLKVTQYSILSHLRRLGPLTINELAGTMALDRTTMGRNLRPLERDGLVLIAADPRDGRRRALSLTDLGLERLRCARAAWAAAQAKFDDTYGAERATTLREILAGVTALDFGGAR